MNEKPSCSLVPRGDEVKTYACGHTGPAHWDFLLAGHKCGVHDDRVDPTRCGQCHLDELVPQLIFCAKCQSPIGPGEGCITYREAEGIHCLGVDCGPGPIAGNPGVWDGKTFKSDFMTGRGMSTFPRC